jgi:hypothetical protein
VAVPPLTEAEVAAILAGPMVIDQPMVWKQKSNDAWAEAQFTVQSPYRGVLLSLRVNVSVFAMRKYSILLLLNEQRVRALDVGGSHENTHTDNHRWNGRAHEHRWTDACHGGWACAATEPAGVEQAFRTCCQQWGIRFAGAWVPLSPSVQLGFDDP